MKFSYNGSSFGEKDMFPAKTPALASGGVKPMTARQQLNARKLWHLFLRPYRPCAGVVFAMVCFAFHFEHVGHWMMAVFLWMTFESLQCWIWESILPVSMLNARKWLLIPELGMEFVLVEGASTMLAMRIVDNMIKFGAFG